MSMSTSTVSPAVTVLRGGIGIGSVIGWVAGIGNDIGWVTGIGKDIGNAIGMFKERGGSTGRGRDGAGGRGETLFDSAEEASTSVLIFSL